MCSPAARQLLQASPADERRCTLAVALMLVQAPPLPGAQQAGRFVPLQACVARITLPPQTTSPAAGNSTSATATQPLASGEVHFLQLQSKQQADGAPVVRSTWTEFTALPLSEVSMRTKTVHMCVLPLGVSTSSGSRPDAAAQQAAAALGMLPTVQLCWHLNGVSPSAAAELQLQHTAAHLQSARHGSAETDGMGAADGELAEALRRGAMFAPSEEDKAGSAAPAVATSRSTALSAVASALQRVPAPRAASLQHWVQCVITLVAAMDTSGGSLAPSWSCLGLCPVPVGAGATVLDRGQLLASVEHALAMGSSPQANGTTARLNAPPRTLIAASELSASQAWGALLPSAAGHCSSGGAAVAAASGGAAAGSAPHGAHMSLAYTVDVHCLSTRNAAVTAHRLDPLLSAGMTLPRPSALHRGGGLPGAMRSSNGHWAAQLHCCHRVQWHFWGGKGAHHAADTRHSLHCALCGVHSGNARGMAAHCRSAHEHLHITVFEQAWHSAREPLVAGGGNIGSTAPLRTLHVHVTAAQEQLTVQPADDVSETGAVWDDAAAWDVQPSTPSPRKRQRSAADASAAEASGGSSRKQARRLAADGSPQRPAGASDMVGVRAFPDLFRVPDCVLPASVLPPSTAEASAAVAAASSLMRANAPIVTAVDACDQEADTPEGVSQDAPATPQAAPPSSPDEVDAAGTALSRQFSFAACRDTFTAEQVAARVRRAAAAAVWGLRGVAPLPVADASGAAAMRHLGAFKNKDTQAEAEQGTPLLAGSFSRWARAAAAGGTSAAEPAGVTEAIAAVQAAVAGGCPPALASKATQPTVRSRAAQGGVGGAGPFGATLGVRQYFHSRTGQPVREWEAAEDSDEEVDSSWMVKVRGAVRWQVCFEVVCSCVHTRVCIQSAR